jgi:hypothetical protein
MKGCRLGQNLNTAARMPKNVGLFSGRLGIPFEPPDRFDSALTITRTTPDSNGYTVLQPMSAHGSTSSTEQAVRGWVIMKKQIRDEPTIS